MIATSKSPMLALTIWQPYAWLVAAGFKCVENRTWRPALDLRGRTMLIHAGKRVADTETCHAVHELLDMHHQARLPESLPTGAIVGCAVLTGVATDPEYDTVLELEHPESSELQRSPWFTGPLAWVFECPVLFAEPIACKGAQGVWRVPEVLRRAIREQYEAATRRAAP